MAGLCRLAFRAPDTAFELAVPADVPLADLLPTVVGYAGGDLDEKGLEHAGWLLQRLGEPPLDQESTPDALGLRDGETLYLRPRRDALPEVHFDDVVDGLAGALRARSDTWRPALTKRLLLGLVLVSLAVGWLVLTLPGPAALREAVGAAVAVLVLAGAAAASRAIGDAATGTALGAALVPFVALVGALIPAGAGDLLGARLLAGGASAAGASVLALAVVGGAAPLFIGGAVTSILAGIAGAVALCGVPITHAVAAIAVIAVAFGSFVPAIAFRLSGLRLPLLPSNAEQLQENIEPYPSEVVLSRGAVADNYMTALYVSTGLVCLACLVVLASGSGWAVYTLATVLSLLMLVHGRAVRSVLQRLAVVVPGAVGIVLLLLQLSGGLAPAGRMLVVAGVLVVAAALAVAAWTVPGRRLLPYWGRAVDWLHSLLAISLLPLVLLVLGVFHVLRAING